MKVALVGYGYWGKNIARNFSQNPKFQLHTICDLDENNLSAASLLYPNCKFISDYKAISDDVDIVALIVPVHLHYPLADYFLDQGKHILLTKPFTQNLEETEKLLQKSREKNLTVFADHTFIFNPAVRKLKELLPKIGDPYLVMSSRLNLGLYQPDVNVIYDLMPHDLSIINYLFNTEILSAETTSFSAAGLPQEDFAQSSLVFENGVRAFVTVSWLSPYKIRDFIVVGSEGMLSYDDNQVTEKVKFYDKGVDISELIPGSQKVNYTAKLNYKAGDSFSPAINGVEALKFEFDEFLLAINDRKVRASYDAVTLRTMRSLEKVINSQEQLKIKKAG